MNKSKEVAGCLLVPGRDPPVLLDQVDEPLDLLAFLVPMLVIITRHLPVLLRRDHGLGIRPLRRPHDRIAIVRLVEDVRIRLMPLDQRLGLRNVGLLARCQDELDRVAQGVDEDVDLGAESAPRTAQRLIVVYPLFSAPAACWCARTTVLSMIIHSRSGSWSASKTRFHTPFLAHRSNRFQTEPHGPNRSGRSRHGAPVLPIQRTALMKRRLSLAVTPGSPGWPGSMSLMRSQSSSLISWRRIGCTPVAKRLGIFAHPAQNPRDLSTRPNSISRTTASGWPRSGSRPGSPSA